MLYELHFRAAFRQPSPPPSPGDTRRQPGRCSLRKIKKERDAGPSQAVQSGWLRGAPLRAPREPGGRAAPWLRELEDGAPLRGGPSSAPPAGAPGVHHPGLRCRFRQRPPWWRARKLLLSRPSRESRRHPHPSAPPSPIRSHFLIPSALSSPSSPSSSPH